MAKRFDFQDDIAGFLCDLDDLSADLEDIRDDAQDEADGQNDPSAREAVKELDAVISLLSQAAERLEKWA